MVWSFSRRDKMLVVFSEGVHRTFMITLLYFGSLRSGSSVIFSIFPICNLFMVCNMNSFDVAVSILGMHNELFLFICLVADTAWVVNQFYIKVLEINKIDSLFMLKSILIIETVVVKCLVASIRKSG